MQNKPRIQKKLITITLLFIVLSVAALVAVYVTVLKKDSAEAPEVYRSFSEHMSTVVIQEIYGGNAEKAAAEVDLAFEAYENRLSLFLPESDIAKINAAAGKGGADVSPETAQLLALSAQLSAESEDAFAITIAPLTLLWGITQDNPKVPSQKDIQALLPLVDDSAIQIEGNHVTLTKEGMGLDLGGIAKGAACSIAQKIYEKNGVKGGYISIGGNICTIGTKPDGTLYRFGFRDPYGTETSYIASFQMQDSTIAVSGGYERFFEENGKRYIHILDPETGWPVESDIVSVGVISPNGAEADFYSTTLYVWGKERTLHYMKNGGLPVIMLDYENRLYVSQSLAESFVLYEEDNFTVTFINGRQP